MIKAKNIYDNFRQKSKAIQYLLIISHIILLLGIFAFLYLNSTDTNDMLFFRVAVQAPYLDFIKDRSEITCRLILETIMYFTIKMPYIVFALITILLIFSAMYCIRYLFKLDDIQFSVGLLVLVTFPTKLLVEAGTQPVVINYIWSLIFCLFSLIPIRKAIDGDKISIPCLILCIISNLIGCNMEQTATLVLGFYIVFIIYFAIKKKTSLPVIIIFVSTLLEFILLIFNSGNESRNILSIVAFWPDYDKLSIIDKTFLGYYTTVNYIFCDFRSLIALFFVSTTILLALQRKKIDLIVCLSSIVPIHYIVIFIIKVLEKLIHINVLGNYAGVSLFDGPGLVIIPSPVPRLIILYTLFIIIAIICFCRIKMDLQKKCFLGIMLIAAFLSRLMLGYSPTVIASGDRTTIFLNVIIFLVSLILIGEIEAIINKKSE